ncbi:hypothetical protein EYS42_15245 [Aquabacterium lacunae]|uniref:Uncharacterized protein n=1 Tax=Aquabacterium lacunae TaxID=2528630 RepID=A0A4Q9GW46_9BURK|nr:hypothetical protein [Aquabacterium lacunae]TBO28359.1 hypothetical protein EYS42_15245 [Aquabacterium lacunae]
MPHTHHAHHAHSAHPRRTPLALATASFLGTLLLAACGGGSGNDTPASSGDTVSARESRATASAGYFVPDNQSQLVVNLSNCTQSTRTNSATTPVSSATLTITATGNVVFRGAVGSATSATDLAQVSSAEPGERLLSFEASNRANNAGVDVRYDMGVSNENGVQIDAYTTTSAAGELQVTAGSLFYECAIQANAFSLPASLTATRLALFTAGATNAVADNLTSEVSLIATSTSATWDGSFGTPWDALDGNDIQYASNRHARLDWSGSTATLATSDRRNGSFTPRALPPSTPDAREYTASYQEVYSNGGRYAGNPFSTLSAQVLYPTDAAASYNLRVRRIGNVIYPQRVLGSVNFTYTSVRSRLGGGDLNGLPNAFYASSNTPITLSTCQRGIQSVQRRIAFLPDQRIIWLDGQNNELARFTPDDNTHQRREFSLLGGNNTTLRATFKVYADGVAAVQDMPSQRLEIGATQGLIEVTYPEGNVTVTDVCTAPALLPQPELTLNSRITSVLDFGGNANLTTNTSGYTCPNDSANTSWRHRIGTDGQFATDTTLPGNAASGFVGWSGGTNWIGQSNARYEESYDAQPGASSGSAGMAHPATTVRANCASVLQIQGSANAPSGMTLVSAP